MALSFLLRRLLMFAWQAHRGKVRSLAFSPDGQLIATATGTGRLVSLWNPLTGELVRKLTPRGDERSTSSVAFAPDAPLFAAALTNSVHVWETTEWKEVSLLWTPSNQWVGNYYELAFGPGASPRLAAGTSLIVALWEDAGQSSPSARVPSTSFRTDHVASLHFSPSTELLGTNVQANAALWNPVTGKLVRHITHTHSLHHGPIRFSPDGQRVAIGYRNLIAIHPVEPDATAVVTCAGHKKAVWSVGWSVDGKSLYTASADGTARQWNPITGVELRTFEWGIGEILCTAFSSDGLLGAAASKDGKVVVWDLDT